MGLSLRLPTSLLLLLIWAILFLPTALALRLMASQPWASWPIVMAATACVTLGLWLLRSLPRSLSAILLPGVIALTLSIRVVQLGLVNFSGTDFSSEFFLHLDWQTIEASWHLYRWRVPLGIAGAVGIFLLCLWLCLRLPKLRLKQSVASSGVFVLGLLGSMYSLPEVRLYQASMDQWRQQGQLPEFYELQQRWQHSALVNTQVPTKSTLQVASPETPKNLILIYLESVGVSLLDSNQWPELMPHLQAMHQQHSLVSHFHASGFITIEGIVNSLCGTLFPFNNSSDSLANGANLGEEMACLGDVLQKANYTNHYLGGASIAFSGKDSFLSAHGYPDPRGIEYWQSKGLQSRKDSWGLSDPDLFIQATNLLEELQQQQTPFNLTLLTIGTHIPGFLYEECQPYAHSDQAFLHALHCTDQLLQQWLDELRHKGLLDNTLVAITADHQVFSNSAMRNIFGDAVYDRRLPLILLDTEPLPSPARDIGAAYDLAPTLLDLLHIQHNVQFPLGRSLLQDTDHPHYFVNRYEDVVSGQTTRRATHACEVNEEAPDQWLELMTACQKGDLFNLLRRQVESASALRVVVNCRNRQPLTVSVGEEEGVQFWINQQSPVKPFTYIGRPIEKNQPGLYMAWFDSNGRLLNWQFSPAKSAHQRLIDLPDTDTAISWLAFWAPDSEARLPEWLPGEHDQPSVFWGVKDENEVYWQVTTIAKEPGFTWSLTQQSCRDLYH